MSLFSKFDKHADLVGKMAKTVGADVVEASVQGVVPETALRTAVYGCMSCKEPEACGTWLAEHAQGSDTTPEYCRNKAMLERLGRA